MPKEAYALHLTSVSHYSQDLRQNDVTLNAFMVLTIHSFLFTLAVKQIFEFFHIRMKYLDHPM